MELLLAAGTVEKLAWVALILLLLCAGGIGISRMGGARHGQDVEQRARRKIDRQFRRPPDEGGLL